MLFCLSLLTLEPLGHIYNVTRTDKGSTILISDWYICYLYVGIQILISSFQTCDLNLCQTHSNITMVTIYIDTRLCINTTPREHE